MEKVFVDPKYSEFITNNKPLEVSLLVNNLKNSLWMLGIPSWLFGLTDRTVATFADGYVSPIEVLQLLTASFFFLSWVYLKPEESVVSEAADGKLAVKPEDEDDNPYLAATKARMTQLQNQHMIRQEYTLPFPYVCQIYHLLNLKHLESIHYFSLNNLRVISVSQFEPTAIGGVIKFQTVLESPVNALRIWRPPVVEVRLTLHSPYTVELDIPVYNDKHIIVMFNVLPLSNEEHKFFIDIYSNLKWPKPLLQIILHLASALTLFEDLPYLKKLAQRRIERLLRLDRASERDTMLLFNRFVDLYGSSIVSAEPKALEQLTVDS